MRPYEEMTDERRCEAGAGLHYKSREWNEIYTAGGGWDGTYPEIDRHGKLTGRIVGYEDGFLNVNDEAMITIEEARAGGWTSPDDGYAEPPQPAVVRVVYWAGTTQVEAEASTYAEATALAAKNRNAHDPSFYEVATGKELFDDGRGLRGEDDTFYTV